MSGSIETTCGEVAAGDVFWLYGVPFKVTSNEDVVSDGRKMRRVLYMADAGGCRVGTPGLVPTDQKVKVEMSDEYDEYVLSAKTFGDAVARFMVRYRSEVLSEVAGWLRNREPQNPLGKYLAQGWADHIEKELHAPEESPARMALFRWRARVEDVSR